MLVVEKFAAIVSPRRWQSNPQVRVILTSGNDDLLDEKSAQSLEVEFMARPFTGQGLA